MKSCIDDINSDDQITANILKSWSHKFYRYTSFQQDSKKIYLKTDHSNMLNELSILNICLKHQNKIYPDQRSLRSTCTYLKSMERHARQFLMVYDTLSNHGQSF